ncbi:hypothetical protein KKA95_03885 [Patescibacteria group bacterium]|nr:hypothetical protein [Patescibacteria group bacterium]
MGLETPRNTEEILAETAKKRASYTRDYIDSEKDIDMEGFIDTLSKEPFNISVDPNDDVSLTKAVYKLQRALDMPDRIGRRGCDGMFGPITYRRFLRREIDSGSRDIPIARLGKKSEPELESPPSPEPALKVTSVENKFILETPSDQPAFNEAFEQKEGLKWVGKLGGNGGRDVGIYVPPNFDSSKPVEFVYHFHGLNGQMIGPKGKGGLNRLRDTLNASEQYNRDPDHNMVLVYPLSAGHRAGRTGKMPKLKFDASWMRAGNSTNDSMDALHDEVTQVLSENFGINPVDKTITVEGHSAGGHPLMTIFDNNLSAKIDKVVFMDASYGVRAPNTYKKAIKHNPDIDFVILAKKDSPTDQELTRSIEGKKGVTYERITGRRHGKFVEFVGGETEIV